MAEEIEAETTKPEVQALDMVAWVGTKNYPTPEAFIEEALAMGVSKRFGGGLPAGIIPNKTKVFLAHEVRPGAEKDEEPDPDVAGYIFAEFTIAGILTVGDVSVNLGSTDLPIQKIKLGEIGDFPQRGCGYLVPGGTYLVSEPDMRSFVAREDKTEVTGAISVFEDPIPLSQDFGKYRGYRYINGVKLLEGASEEEWMEVDKIKKANAKVRKGEPVGPKNTVKQAVLDLLEGNKGKMELGELIDAVREKVPSESNRARVMVRTMIGKMDKAGMIQLAKVETVTLLKKE